MAQLHLHRVHMLTPFTEFLHSFGARVEYGMTRAKLPVHCLDDPQGYIASQALWDFGYRMERLEGIEGLGFLAAEHAGADLVAAGFRRKLEAAPSLYRGIALLQKQLRAETSGTKITLTRTKNNGLRIFYSITFGPEHESYDTFVPLCLAGLMEVIRVYTGPNWRPQEIGVQMKKPVSRALLERFPDTRIIKTSQNYIDVEASACSAPAFELTLSEPPDAATADILSPDLCGSISKLLTGYHGQQYPALEQVAEFSGLSARTLQRQLAGKGKSFRDLVSEARYQRACYCLQYTGEPIADIAYSLGYGNPTHFSRAFARMAGVSPKTFRKLRRSILH